MSDLIKRLKGLYSVSEKDGVICEDRDFGNFTPKINLEAVALIEAQKEEIVELKKTTIPISKLEELISISDGFDNYAYSKNDLRQLIKEVKG